MDINSQHLELIQELYPDIELSNVDVGSDGLTNDVVIVNRQGVFRFPKNKKAEQALANESRVLSLVHQHVDTRTPVFEHIGDDLVVYDYIPGNALSLDSAAAHDESTADAYARQLAGFLRQLHSIPRDAIASHEIAGSLAARTPQQWHSMFEHVEKEVFPYLWADQKEWVRRLFEPILESRVSMDYDPVLIHGDLGAYHILCDPDNRRINGIIDFGTAGLGDPASDFGIIINQFGERFLARMAKYYPQIGNAISRARFRASAVELEWVLNGIFTKDISWFMAHLGRSRDIMPIEDEWETP